MDGTNNIETTLAVLQYILVAMGTILSLFIGITSYFIGKRLDKYEVAVQDLAEIVIRVSVLEKECENLNEFKKAINCLKAEHNLLHGKAEIAYEGRERRSKPRH
jgi:K+-transporting ATPase A subunit